MIESPNTARQLDCLDAETPDPGAARVRFRRAAPLWGGKRGREQQASLGRGLARKTVFPILRWTLQRAIHTMGMRARGEQNARALELRHERFAFPRLPAGLSGIRILLLADLHLDGLDGLVECVEEAVRRTPVDLCLLAGDYRFAVDGPCDALYAGMRRVVGSIRARSGVVGVLGNHDPAELVPVLERMGVTMLVNEALEVRRGGEGLWVAGLDDPHHYKADDLERALRPVPPDAFKILLVHSPHRIAAARENGVDLYLCGHTHGGQICLPWIGSLGIGTGCAARYVRGAWRDGSLQGYTSPGVGVSCVPVRFHCPPEVAVIELVREGSREVQNVGRPLRPASEVRTRSLRGKRIHPLQAANR